MRRSNKDRGKSKKRTTLRWKKKSSHGHVIHEAKIPGHPDLLAVVGQHPEGWVVGLFNQATDQLKIYEDFVFRSVDAAKMEVQALIDATIHDVRRVANREIGDVVLAAEQYFSAQQDELDLMKRGTPEQLARARKRTKQAKEALEDMTGANQELYGAMGGGTLGAALGALTGNPFAAAIGALAGSVAGSLIGRPSLPKTKPDGAGGGRSGDDNLVQMPRRPARAYPRAANRD